MKNLELLNTNYYNKSFRLPKDIIEKNEQHPILDQFMLVSVGHLDAEHSIGHYVRRYSKEEYIVIYCVDGEGWVEFKGKKQIIKSGDIFFCLCDTIHCYGAHGKNPWTIYWSCFKGSQFIHYLDPIGITEDKLVLQIGENIKIISLFLEILEILESGFAAIHLFYVSNCLKLILNCISLQGMYSEHKPSAEPIIENAIAFMLKNIETKLYLDELSCSFNMSKDYFVKFFKKKTGYTPIDYFIGLKMQKACHLLQTTNLRIKDISCQLGYEDVYYFSRIFKSKIGYSPKRYYEKVKA